MHGHGGIVEVKQTPKNEQTGGLGREAKPERWGLRERFSMAREVLTGSNVHWNRMKKDWRVVEGMNGHGEVSGGETVP